MASIITATDYQARVLQAQGRPATSFRHFMEARLAAQGITFLSTLAEQGLWYEAVQDLDFANKAALVTECMQAFHTMMLYGIAPEDLYGFDSEGVVLFRKLLKRFLRKDQPTFLQALKNLKIETTQELFGFTDLPPLYQQSWQKPPLIKGVPHSGGGISAHTQQAPNPETEFLQALTSIETLWQNNPNKTFALVIQQNTLSWQKIHRLLQTHSSPMQIACSKAPMFADQPKCLFLKDLFASATSTDLLLMSRVLISPFWPDDLKRRAQLDVWMRDNLLRTTNLTDLLQNLLFKDPDIQNTAWFQAWAKLASFKIEELTEFAETFLSAAAITSVIPAIGPLPAKAGTGIQQASLHIVSTLEAADLPVDGVWLLSADTDHYPLRKSPPAFLPKSLLIAKGVPIKLEDARNYGQKLIHAITAGKEVYASFVPQIRGEQKQLSGFIAARHPEAILPSKIELRIQPSVGNKDRLVSDGWIPCSAPRPQDDGVISGGSQLLKEQAECPFRAFAHFRLNVKALGQGRELLDPMQKGLLIHAALEKIWQELKSQQALLVLNTDERQALIARKVDAVLFARQNPLLKKLERERLIRILTEWLGLEALRPPFTVEACERKELVSIGKLQLRLRLDRVDQVGDSRLIIDYKTGEISSKGWFEERLREPQLPLYVVTNAAEGAIFASLKVGKMAYAGVVKHSDDQFAQVKVLEDWDKQTLKWQSQLETLAAEFQQGRADVAPIDAQVCTYCDLVSFCRIKTANG